MVGVGADPAGVVRFDPVAADGVVRLASVGLVVLSMEGKRGDGSTEADVIVGVLVPADGIEEEIAGVCVGDLGQVGGVECEVEGVAAVEDDEGVVAGVEEVGDRSIAGTPAGEGRVPRGCHG